MEVISLPFTKNNGITLADKDDYLLKLVYGENILNHLKIVHASASYALAETSSGFFLQKNFADIADQTIPILHSSNVKYKKGGLGTLFSTAKLIDTNKKELLSQLQFKRKALFVIQVKLYNEQKEVVMIGDFQWFVTLKES